VVTYPAVFGTRPKLSKFSALVISWQIPRCDIIYHPCFLSAISSCQKLPVPLLAVFSCRFNLCRLVLLLKEGFWLL